MIYLKGFLLFVTWMATITSAILVAMSFGLWQPDGMFWYGIALIASGLSMRASIKWFLKE